MAATCARFIAIQRQNTPRRHIPTPRQIHQTLDKSRFIFRLSVSSGEAIEARVELPISTPQRPVRTRDYNRKSSDPLTNLSQCYESPPT
jgi:hypothetical protein